MECERWMSKVITCCGEKGMVISKYLTLYLEKCQLWSQNISVAVIIEYPACVMCTVYMGLKPQRPKYLLQTLFFKGETIDL